MVWEHMELELLQHQLQQLRRQDDSDRENPCGAQTGRHWECTKKPTLGQTLVCTSSSLLMIAYNRIESLRLGKWAHRIDVVTRLVLPHMNYFLQQTSSFRR